jgi:hypothetical protein
MERKEQTMTEFREFQKIPRLYREVIVTEKIDGTNACVVIGEDCSIAAQSRSRLITPQDDNYGFAKWVEANADELRKLGPGYHYGEWWGLGINRNYGLTEKRFSLFNTHRWSDEAGHRPACCHVVPVLMRGDASQSFSIVPDCIQMLRDGGSWAAKGFMKPEGVVAFHVKGNLLFKATLEKDEEWKGKSKP